MKSFSLMLLSKTFEIKPKYDIKLNCVFLSFSNPLLKIVKLLKLFKNFPRISLFKIKTILAIYKNTVYNFFYLNKREWIQYFIKFLVSIQNLLKNFKILFYIIQKSILYSINFLDFISNCYLLQKTKL